MKQKHSNIKRKLLLKGYRQYLPFVCCLLISAGFWFTREMGKTYQEQIDFSVRYENIPKSKSLVSKMPESLVVTVESTGWGLMRHFVFSDNSVTVDVGALDELNEQTVVVRKADFLTQLQPSLKILSVFPETMTFEYAPINSKKVPVKTQVSLSFRQQYELDGKLQVAPDSVWLYGAEIHLDTIQEVVCPPVEIKKIRESFSQELPIQPIPGVQMSDEHVTISGMVEKFTEQSVTVPIKLLNAPQDDSIAIDLMKDRVTVRFLVAINKVESYYPSDFEAIADYEKINEKGMVPVDLVRYPSFVRISFRDPQSVGVVSEILLKND